MKKAMNLSPEARKACSDAGKARKGYKHTEESKRKMRENKPRKFRSTKYGCQIEARVREYQKTAQERGIEWNLNPEIAREFFVSDCYYCGKKSEWDARLKKAGEKIRPNGIDRIDNDRGYVQGNCVSCCFRCNVAKHTEHHDDFLNRVKKIYENLKLEKGPRPLSERQSGLRC